MASSKPSNFMHLGNVDHIEKLYAQYQKDPMSVEPSWRYFFEGMEYSAPSGAISHDLKVTHLIDAYRRYGHLQAHTNPLSEPKPAHELQLSSLGFDASELTESFPSCAFFEAPYVTLDQLIEHLEGIYCGSVGIEYMGCHSPELEKWLQQHVEPSSLKSSFSIEKKKDILHHLNRSELFEIFLHTKYVGQKRFSLEGGETLIPVLAEIVELGSELGMDEFVIGMAHRGRLNVLTTVLNKSFSMIFSEFEDYYDPALTEASGDVKYHKGYSADITTSKGKQVHVGLASNPSHLESVDPIVLGKTYAKQHQKKDSQKKQVVPILIHGDSSLAGQGVVYESLQLGGLNGYNTGGTIHIVINNQIGFTTLPSEYRSTRYSTDIAQTFSAPVFHVNAEDPEGCVLATQLALQIRQQFHCDVFIDMICYRKYGHNEGDEPAFTQPKEYQTIRKRHSIRELYRDHLIQEGVVEKEMASSLEKEFQQALHFELEELKISQEVSKQPAFLGKWENFIPVTTEGIFKPVHTGVKSEKLKQLSEAFSQYPEEFTLHPKLKKLVENRLQAVQSGKDIDWALAEHLAFASLLQEGVDVRLAGQDVQRGTFTQRHAVWVDQSTSVRHFPLATLGKPQGHFSVINSPLSEFASLGFEFGYSLSHPEGLVLWEAQFGDFANGAQVVVDQYLSGSEQKWQRSSGLVLLLPHGYEGQGPEHSSGRLERYLQMCAENNMQVVYPSTPGQYFHLLRRQVLRPFRLPLIVFTPKGLLRHRQCTSSLETFEKESFQEIIDDPIKNPKRLLLTSGRFYYELIHEREQRQADDVAIVRIEQLYPLHRERFVQMLERYEKVSQVSWVQEEPENMGALHYLYPILTKLVPSIRFVSRKSSASTASGSHTKHKQELDHLMDQIFGG